jgi:hypothetical protein
LTIVLTGLMAYQAQQLPEIEEGKVKVERDL